MERDATFRFVDLATARGGRGVRMLALSALPSSWSEAAKGLFHLARVPVLAVRFRRGDAEQAAWVGVRNAPAVLHDDDPPRSGWAEFTTLADRLGGPGSLVPIDTEARLRLFGLLHEIAGEDGLGWNARLMMIDGSLASDGARSFPLRVANYLGKDYGHTPGCADHARQRIGVVLALLDQQLRRSHGAGHAYMLGPAVTALDVYAATFLTPLVPLLPVDCPQMLDMLRPAFTYLVEQVGALVPPALAAHRRFMFERLLAWPIAL
jgi:hypothetical protein